MPTRLIATSGKLIVYQRKGDDMLIEIDCSTSYQQRIIAKKGRASNEFVNIEDLTVEEIVNKLTMSGLEVEDIENLSYIIFVKGDDSLARNYADILQVSFSSVKSLYDDKHDRLNFIKNFLRNFCFIWYIF